VTGGTSLVPLKYAKGGPMLLKCVGGAIPLLGLGIHSLRAK